MVSVPCPHRQLHAPGKAPTLIHEQVPLPGQWIERYSLSGSKVCKVSYKWVGRATGIFKAGHAAKVGGSTNSEETTSTKATGEAGKSRPEVIS